MHWLACLSWKCKIDPIDAKHLKTLNLNTEFCQDYVFPLDTVIFKHRKVLGPIIQEGQHKSTLTCLNFLNQNMKYINQVGTKEMEGEEISFCYDSIPQQHGEFWDYQSMAQNIEMSIEM